MAIGSLVAAIPLSSNHALIGQSYNDSLEMQDTTDIKPVGILVRDSYAPAMATASAARKSTTSSDAIRHRGPGG